MTEGHGNVRDLTIATLDRIATGGQDWPHVADKYGVTNPVPPWKSSLDGICDALDVNGQALPLLERRRDEDVLSQAIYADLPAPERQLVALVRSRAFSWPSVMSPSASPGRRRDGWRAAGRGPRWW